MKYIKNLQIWLVLLAFLITLGILFGGQTLTTKLRVDDPLKRDIAAIKSVSDFKTEETKNGLTVHLRLRKVADLDDVMEQIKQKVQQFQDKPVVDFQIQDHPNPLLKQLKYQLSFYLEEANTTGRYTQLKNALDSFHGVTARVYLEKDFIYIQLEDGNFYLYQAVPRIATAPGLKSDTGGDLG